MRMSNKVRFQTTESQGGRIIVIAGGLLALMAWMTLAITPPGLWSRVVRLVAAASAVIAVGGLLWLLIQRQLGRQGTILGHGQGSPYAIPVIIGLVIVGFACALLPMPPGYEWAGTVATALCIVPALLLGVRLARNGTPALFYQARYAHRQGDNGRALTLLSQLEKERPDFYGMYHLYALIHRERGDYPAAHAACHRLIALRPDLYFGYAEEGLTWLAQGKPQEARDALQQAVRIAPRLPQAHFNLGMAHAQLAEHQQAIASLSRALRLGLGDEVTQLLARYYLLRAFLALGYEEQARIEWRRLRRRRDVLDRWRAEDDNLVHGRAARKKVLAEIERALATYPGDGQRVD